MERALSQSYGNINNAGGSDFSPWHRRSLSEDAEPLAAGSRIRFIGKRVEAVSQAGLDRVSQVTPAGGDVPPQQKEDGGRGCRGTCECLEQRVSDPFECGVLHGRKL